jgi:hypothetical protein
VLVCTRVGQQPKRKSRNNMGYKSERTKKLEEAKVDNDMPTVKRAVKKTAVGVSKAIDKVESLFKKNKPEEKKYAKGGDVKKFKPCSGCPSPVKCKAAGKCLAGKKAATGMLVIPVKMEKKSAAKKRK